MSGTSIYYWVLQADKDKVSWLFKISRQLVVLSQLYTDRSFPLAQRS